MFKPKTLITPDPGRYEYKSFIGEGPKYSFRDWYEIDGTKKGKRNKNAHRKQSFPGPGKYNITDPQSGPKYTMGYRRTKKLNKKNLFISPGVGTYELRNDNAFFVPMMKFGPGYTPADKTDKTVSSKERNDTHKNKTDSYEDYKINTVGMSTVGPKYSFSRSKRLCNDNNGGSNSTNGSSRTRPTTPGPGSYATQTFFGKNGAKYSFGKEIAIPQEKNINPPPGTYFKSIAYKPDTAQYSLGKSLRPGTATPGSLLPPQFQNKVIASFEMPGPGKYNPNHLVLSTKQTFPSWGVSKENRMGVEKENPERGPGTYTVKNGTIPEGRMITMGNRLSDKKGDNYPGPGSYQTVTVNRPSEPVYSIGKLERGEDNKQTLKDNYPGPGKYDVRDVVMTRPISFPKGGLQSKKTNEQLGPGSYKIPCRFNDINNITRDGGRWDIRFKYV